MHDPVPDRRNRFAYWLGKVFHPYVICVPTLIALLWGEPWVSLVGWVTVMVAILLPPLLVTGLLLKHRQRHLYQRASRAPMYLVFWGSLLICLGVLIALNAPHILITCVVALMLWLPLQLAINTYVTKVSTHAAVVVACVMGLGLLGKLTHPWLLLAALLAVGLTLWARVATRNHTLTQVIVGSLTGAISVLIVFPLMLR
ncbi:MAG: hypothetical protein SF123_04200 [Chloroflexota bacterium]|nr:hypothetical protein [Chloroflexota bacterium]